MIGEQMWNVIAHIKKQFKFTICGFGDFKQLKPVNEEHIDFLNSWIIKYIFNNNLCELTEIHRFNENKLLQDAIKCANDENIDFNNYSKEEHDLSLCWTNQAVDAINKKWNITKDKQIEVCGYNQSKFILHNGLKLMSYKSYGKLFYNSEDFIVKSFDDKTMTLLNEIDNIEIKVELKLTNHFKPLYAITIHKAQGMTINRPYSIYEYKRMKHNMLYVSLTRTSKKEFVNFCEFDGITPYTAYIYRYSYNNISYIGSTTNIKKRKEEHKKNKNNNNKFGLAIYSIGYKNSKFEILETVNYLEKQSYMKLKIHVF